MDAVDRFLRELEGASLLEPRDPNDGGRYGSSSALEEPTCSQIQAPLHARTWNYTQQSNKPHHPNLEQCVKGVLDTEYIEEDLPLDAFGQTRDF